VLATIMTKFKAPVHSSLLSEIVMSEMRKYTIKILAKCIKMKIYLNKTILTINRTDLKCTKISLFILLTNK